MGKTEAPILIEKCFVNPDMMPQVVAMVRHESSSSRFS